jgi:hypothetical protein
MVCHGWGEGGEDWIDIRTQCNLGQVSALAASATLPAPEGVNLGQPPSRVLASPTFSHTHQFQIPSVPVALSQPCWNRRACLRHSNHHEYRIIATTSLLYWMGFPDPCSLRFSLPTRHWAFLWSPPQWEHTWLYLHLAMVYSHESESKL